MGTGSSVHYMGGVQTSFSSWARIMEPGPEVAMHPSTAERLGLKPGDEVDVGAPLGRMSAACVFREDLPAGVVAVGGMSLDARGLFTWPVSGETDVLATGPVVVSAAALSRRTAGSVQE
jgi:anaerobic selenocysteine-containing dehydrogenase